jgi:hypothetical protein
MGQQSFKDPSYFNSYENNYVGLRLDLKNNSGNEVVYSNKESMVQSYFCMTTSTTPPQQYPLATFSNFEDCVDFVATRISDRLIRLETLTNPTSTDAATLESNAEKLTKFTFEYWPIINEGSYETVPNKDVLKETTKKMIELVNSN